MLFVLLLSTFNIDWAMYLVLRGQMCKRQNLCPGWGSLQGSAEQVQLGWVFPAKTQSVMHCVYMDGVWLERRSVWGLRGPKIADRAQSCEVLSLILKTSGTIEGFGAEGWYICSNTQFGRIPLGAVRSLDRSREKSREAGTLGTKKVTET